MLPEFRLFFLFRAKNLWFLFRIEYIYIFEYRQSLLAFSVIAWLPHDLIKCPQNRWSGAKFTWNSHANALARALHRTNRLFVYVVMCAKCLDHHSISKPHHCSVFLRSAIVVKMKWRQKLATAAIPTLTAIRFINIRNLYNLKCLITELRIACFWIINKMRFWWLDSLKKICMAHKMLCTFCAWTHVSVRSIVSFSVFLRLCWIVGLTSVPGYHHQLYFPTSVGYGWLIIHTPMHIYHSVSIAAEFTRHIHPFPPLFYRSTLL